VKVKVDKKLEALERAKVKVKTTEQIEAEIDAIRDDINEVKRDMKSYEKKASRVQKMFENLARRDDVAAQRGRA
jgi:DNA repair exonuclease SbcCD ATPase subunit